MTRGIRPAAITVKFESLCPEWLLRNTLLHLRRLVPPNAAAFTDFAPADYSPLADQGGSIVRQARST
jgi:hypothetical protein